MIHGRTPLSLFDDDRQPHLLGHLRHHFLDFLPETIQRFPLLVLDFTIHEVDFLLILHHPPLKLLLPGFLRVGAQYTGLLHKIFFHAPKLLFLRLHQPLAGLREGGQRLHRLLAGVCFVEHTLRLHDADRPTGPARRLRDRGSGAAVDQKHRCDNRHPPHAIPSASLHFLWHAPFAHTVFSSTTHHV